jgi:hypothetical protein
MWKSEGYDYAIFGHFRVIFGIVINNSGGCFLCGFGFGTRAVI